MPGASIGSDRRLIERRTLPEACGYRIASKISSSKKSQKIDPHKKSSRHDFSTGKILLATTLSGSDAAWYFLAEHKVSARSDREKWDCTLSEGGFRRDRRWL